MQVFKAYLKIIRKNIPQLLIYVVICVALSVMLTMFNTQDAQTDFSGTKVKMAVFNDDKAAGNETGVAGGLHAYLSENADIVELPDDLSAIKDALFYREVSYVLRIPEGFTSDFAAEGHAISLRKTAVPDSAAALYTDMLINRYLNMYRMYMAGMPAATPEEISAFTGETLAISTPVSMNSGAVAGSVKGESDYNVVYFFNYLAYALFSILILGVSTCMFAFNNIDLKRRNLSSPMTLKSMNAQMVAGNFVFTSAAWIVMMVIGLILFAEYMTTWNGLLLCLNSFVFALAGLSISYLIGNLLRSRNAQTAVSNVVALGTCFISGVFVPQDILGSFVLGIAKFTPTYWYVRANNKIGTITAFTTENMKEIFSYMIVVAGFAVVMLAISFIVIRRKRTSE